MSFVHSTRSHALAAAAVLALGCTEADPDGTEAVEPVESTSSPEILDYGCHQHAAGQDWQNGFVPQQTGWFSTRFILEPSQNPMDGVIGLSNGPADAFTDLAAIVRLNPSGQIDVRNGSTYMADTPFTYQPDTRVRVDMHVDIPNRVYTVYLHPTFEWDPDAPRITLARDYRFRSEQAAASRLDNVGRIVDSATGSFELCAVSTSSTCLRPTPGSAWLSQSFPTRVGRFRVTFAVNPGDFVPTDLVVGLSNGAPTGFASLAAILRFNADGYLDVRDGATYRYDAPLTYAVGQSFRALMDVDVATRTYSVSVTRYGFHQEPVTVTLATNYRFRSEQAYVTALSHFGTFVDSAAGNPDVCSLLVDYD